MGANGNNDETESLRAGRKIIVYFNHLPGEYLAQVVSNDREKLVMACAKIEGTFTLEICRFIRVATIADEMDVTETGLLVPW